MLAVAWTRPRWSPLLALQLASIVVWWLSFHASEPPSMSSRPPRTSMTCRIGVLSSISVSMSRRWAWGPILMMLSARLSSSFRLISEPVSVQVPLHSSSASWAPRVLSTMRSSSATSSPPLWSTYTPAVPPVRTTSSSSTVELS
jgi:hypothetical protein